MNVTLSRLFPLLIFATGLKAAEWHVALRGNDAAAGSAVAPLRTIQRAAELAQAGDVITVHCGVYRERINPPRGGTSEKQRIVYRAAPGEKVEIKGSEVIKGWVKLQQDTWKVEIPNAFFGSFNPYQVLLQGDWFDPRGRQHHPGAVYLNGQWLAEAARLEEVLEPAGATGLWFGQVDPDHTTIRAQFKGVDPNQQQVEINVRQTVFYPDRPGRNFITVRGFELSQAATPWAPPTAEQIGLLGTHWSKGWLIESNRISYSVCCGIALGKYGDQWDNTSANTAEGYVKTIQRALQNGWDKETVGHHLVRNNVISHCEQAGIVGSLGAAFSTISANSIHDIHVRGLFSGAEMAGIKIHAAIDTCICGNHIYRTCRGLWLDWMAQGTSVSGNLFHDNAGEDLFVEVDHGPFLADNNLFLSRTSLRDMSEGGAYAHNLFAGLITTSPEPSRYTPFLLAHSTAVAGLEKIQGGDDRFYNNLFLGNGATSPARAQPSTRNRGWETGYGLGIYDNCALPLRTGGNVFLGGAQPSADETACVSESAPAAQAQIFEDGRRFVLRLTSNPVWRRAPTQRVTTALLGRTKVAGVRYENPDGSPLQVNRDYFGKKRSRAHPCPGPFESRGGVPSTFTVWGE
ncbi:MAG TPA: right-handed parallel beta-helix repeat-containing protein [Verrucomicrobiae bacterium]|nr:right-handed parallel beta-helix repeat-containing protein [Verrucomicrobiae bacterium]